MALIEEVRQKASAHNTLLANVYFSQVVDLIRKAAEKGCSRVIWNRTVRRIVPSKVFWPWMMCTYIVRPSTPVCSIIESMLKKEGFKISMTYEGDLCIKW